MMVLPMANQEKKQMFQKYPSSQHLMFSTDLQEKDKSWVIMEGEIYDANSNRSTTSSSSSIGEESTTSNSSVISSLDTTDDATSSSTNSSGSLYDLTDLISQLPIKRGLSKFYEGKSQSYTSLSMVRNIEDIPKKESPYNNRRKLMKASKSHGGGLNNYKSHTLPKSNISKKISRGLVSSFSDKRGSFLSNYSPPVGFATKE